RMPVSEPPMTPPPMLLSRNRTRRRAASRDGAAVRASPPCGPTCIAAADCTSGHRRWSTNVWGFSRRHHQSVTPFDRQHEAERIQPETVRDVGAGEILGVFLEALARITGLETREQCALVECSSTYARLEQLGARLVFGRNALRADAHGDQRDHCRHQGAPWQRARLGTSQWCAR